MTTVSDAFDASQVGASIREGHPAGARARARVRARLDATERDGKIVRKIRYAGWVLGQDVANSWVWAGSPPTLLDLWRDRVPDIERVPGNNRGLWVLWVVFNHLALIWTAVLCIPLWVLQHPARTLLAAALAAPLIALWFIG